VSASSDKVVAAEAVEAAARHQAFDLKGKLDDAELEEMAVDLRMREIVRSDLVNLKEYAAARAERAQHRQRTKLARLEFWKAKSAHARAEKALSDAKFEAAAMVGAREGMGVVLEFRP
jgi:hypothetical protein